ncbi:hypothetical protein ACL02R_08185 [Streptomyces sp. MS19]|uniref:hypothetical protein n=1 Tax=Streptomyces sp. MS19 TaxID=3385972 RepID=UPI00399FA846
MDDDSGDQQGHRLRSGFEGGGLSGGCPGHVVRFLPAARLSGQCLAGAAFQIAGSWDSTSTVDRQLRPHRTDRLSGSIRGIQDGAGSIAAISEVLARVGAEPVLRTFTAGTSDERTLYRALGSRAVYVKRLLPVRLPVTCASCRFNNDTDCQEGYYGVRLYLTEQGQYMVGVCIQRMDLCVPVAELPKSGIVEEVRAFKDAEIRRLTSQYGAAA